MEGSPETFQSWSCASQSLTETSNDGCSALRRQREIRAKGPQKLAFLTLGSKQPH